VNVPVAVTDLLFGLSVPAPLISKLEPSADLTTVGQAEESPELQRNPEPIKKM
jgi:hypothetical protein